MATAVYAADILLGLRRLGLPDDAQVLVHSSLRSLGTVMGGAEAVIAALQDAVGSGGTVLMPTLTGSEALSVINPPIFDPDSTPCWSGRIPETFRTMPGVLRSLHPTHSVAAIGPNAERLIGGHALSVTPCDERSPYGLLAREQQGYILLLGVTHQSNTTLHHVEELAGVPYHIQPGFVRARVLVGGVWTERNIMLHRYGSPRQFEVIEPMLVERGAQRMVSIGDAAVRLVEARAMVQLVLAALRVDPSLLLAGA
jgi:aminoglycoside 3-N-acetyltransferase